MSIRVDKDIAERLGRIAKDLSVSRGALVERAFELWAAVRGERAKEGC